MSRIKNTTTDKKRHGQHRKHTHSYRKVYWPYLPMLVALFFVLSLGSIVPANRLGQVLGFAEDINQASLLEATNKQRIDHNQAPLNLNNNLSAAAQAKAADMSQRNYWSHETPDGEQPWMFIDNAGFDYARAGENLAYGFMSSSATVAGWMDSQSHRENLLDQGYTDVGFGIVNAANYLGKSSETIVVAFYAVPASLSIIDDTVAASVADDTNVPSSVNRSGFPVTSPVSFASVLTSGSTPWVSFALGAVTGTAAMFLIVRHGLRLKRIMRDGEHFIMHHPVLDLSVTALIVVAVLLSQTVGLVL